MKQKPFRWVTCSTCWKSAKCDRDSDELYYLCWDCDRKHGDVVQLYYSHNHYADMTLKEFMNKIGTTSIG